MAQLSIKQLRVYQLSSDIEDRVIALLSTKQPDESYDRRIKLRRTASAISHYIYEAHHRYSYVMKIEAFQYARQATEAMERQLAALSDIEAAAKKDILASSVALEKQLWGLIKYLRLKQSERSQGWARRSADELVTARS